MRQYEFYISTIVLDLHISFTNAWQLYTRIYVLVVLINLVNTKKKKLLVWCGVYQNQIQIVTSCKFHPMQFVMHSSSHTHWSWRILQEHKNVCNKCWVTIFGPFKPHSNQWPYFILFPLEITTCWHCKFEICIHDYTAIPKHVSIMGHCPSKFHPPNHQVCLSCVKNCATNEQLHTTTLYMMCRWSIRYVDLMWSIS